MSTTLKSIPYVRFIRQVRTDQAALVATQSTLDKAIEDLKVAPWRQTAADITTTMPASNPAQTSSSDTYDAYKFSGDCAANSGVQAAFVGMVAYRWKIPAAALGNTPATKITATAQLYANKFLSAGLRVTSFVSAEADPANLGTWEFLRGDAGGTTLVSALFKNDYAGTKLSSNSTGTVTLLTDVEAAQYLWVIVQLEDWSEIKFEYWIEGAGFLNATTMSATFDADGITLDAAEEPTFSFPVAQEDLYGSQKVYPLDDVVDNRIITLGSVTDTFSTAEMLETKQIGVFQYAGTTLSVALKLDGTVIQTTDMAIADPPAGLSDVIAISVGQTHVLALKSDGTVVAWGGNVAGQSTVPPGLANVVSISAGRSHSIALKSDKTAVIWGTGSGTLSPDISAIAGGDGYSLYVYGAERKVAVAGTPPGDIGSTIPAGLRDVVAVSAGKTHAVALKSDGTVVAWGGANTYGERTVPNGLTGVVAVCCKCAEHTLALKSDGTIVSWGRYTDSSLVPPANLAGVHSISASLDVSAILTSGNWQKVVVHSNNYPMQGLTGSGAVRRERAVKRIVDNASALTTELCDVGTFNISGEDANGLAKMSIAVKAFKFGRQHESLAPNKIHISLPAIDATVYSELYLHTLVLQDNNTVPLNPLSSIDNWKSIWYGGVPDGYTLAASKYLRHTGFVNSEFVDVSVTGYNGVLWLLIIPIQIPLAGDAIDWAIVQSGFNADHIFLYRQ